MEVAVIFLSGMLSGMIALIVITSAVIHISLHKEGSEDEKLSDT